MTPSFALGKTGNLKEMESGLQIFGPCPKPLHPLVREKGIPAYSRAERRRPLWRLLLEMVLKENGVRIVAIGSHSRTSIRTDQSRLLKATDTVAVNHVIKREETVSVINVIERAEHIMSRSTQNKAIRGSQKWLQEFVNRYPELLNDTLWPRLHLGADDTIEWCSPLEEDGYAEYQDEAFLKRVSVSLEKRSLNSFWPCRGPVWDGLARISRGDIILVEAKAHVSELTSSCQAGPQSQKLIRDSLAETAEFYNATSPQNWLHGHYQYANRLAHHYLLRHLNGIQAWLVFIYFINDCTMLGPDSVRGWQSAIEAADGYLGITRTRLEPFVVNVFLDVTTIPRVDIIEKEHRSQGALGTLDKYRVSVMKRPENGSWDFCRGYPIKSDAFNSKDALWQTLKQEIKGNGK